MRAGVVLSAAPANAQIDAEVAEKGGFRTKTDQCRFRNILNRSQCTFLGWKPATFRQIKEIKHLRAGVVLYAAQANVQIDAEVAEKGGFQTKTDQCRFRNILDRSQCTFLDWKPAIFRHIKEIKHLRGGVVLYAAPANAQIDAERAE